MLPRISILGMALNYLYMNILFAYIANLYDIRTLLLFIYSVKFTAL